MFHSTPDYLLRSCRSLIQCSYVSSASKIIIRHSSSNTTYRAAVCTEYGKPLQLQTFRQEKLERGQVRIALKYTGINFADLLLCQGKYQTKQAPPFISGFEASGEISEISPDVTQYKVGDRVAVALTGRSRVEDRGGFFSEQAIIKSEGISLIPATISFEEAAAFQASYSTAYLTLKHKANLQSGETVLITAAAGATGLACLDLAKNVFGAKVIGLAGGASKCQLLKERGADEAVDYNQSDFKSKVMEFTKQRGADVVVDMVGGKLTNDCFKCLAFNGRIMIVGFAGGDIPKIAANQLLLKSASAIGVWWGQTAVEQPELADQITAELNQLLFARKLKPYVGRIFPLSKTNEAFQHIASRESVGKILIDVNN